MSVVVLYKFLNMNIELRHFLEKHDIVKGNSCYSYDEVIDVFELYHKFMNKKIKDERRNNGKYCDYFSLTLDGMQTDKAAKLCKLL